MKTYLCVALMALGLIACSAESTSNKTPATQNAAVNVKLHGSAIEESLGDDLRLIDSNGNPASLQDFQGKVVAVSFGYTHCPDVCPTNLLDLAKTMKLLGEDAAKVQVLFVSVDPSRDTPTVLKEYVPLFDERFIGLTAPDDAAMAPVLKAWKVAATKVPVSDGHYTVDHSAGLYLVNPQGKAAVYLPYGSKAEAIAQDIQALLR
ncbi:SCO family protein [Vitreoscilla stercoraria]|uniref:SCO family protein n=1 Tax=Vitreoscilla stercoraria TaxID=61 RepID=A0ABY4EAL7_VITST|nr:SCO family protein [Vitreoscilla stercoraria]UOO92492.1 SCO family protein [Vitreoscilla stercoraria]